MKSSWMVSHTKMELVSTVSETVSVLSSVSDVMSGLTVCFRCVDHLIKQATEI